MGAAAGHNSTFSTGGTATSFTNEATTRVTANTVYRITDAVKRVLDPGTAVVVEVDADGAGAGAYAVADPSSYALDYLDGKVTFTADQGGSALVRVSGKYIPRLVVATAKSTYVDIGQDAGDSTIYGDTGKRQTPTLKTLSGSSEHVDDLFTDHDPGGGVVTFQAAIDAQLPVLLEFWPGGAGNKLRAWVLIGKGAVKAPAKDLVAGTISFDGVNRDCVVASGPVKRASFGWCAPT
jgi:hypothetical protein